MCVCVCVLLCLSATAKPPQTFQQLISARALTNLGSFVLVAACRRRRRVSASAFRSVARRRQRRRRRRPMCGCFQLHRFAVIWRRKVRLQNGAHTHEICVGRDLMTSSLRGVAKPSWRRLRWRTRTETLHKVHHNYVITRLDSHSSPSRCTRHVCKR